MIASKSLVAVVLLALAAGASAFPWQPCGLSNVAQIRRIELTECNQNSTERCQVWSGSRTKFEIEFIQSKPITRPVLRLGFENGYYDEITPINSGLDLPGMPFQTQTVKGILHIPKFGNIESFTMQLTVRDLGTPIEEAQLCIELPIELYSWKFLKVDNDQLVEPSFVQRGPV